MATTTIASIAKQYGADEEATLDLNKRNFGNPARPIDGFDTLQLRSRL
eukprot:COSAG04_NODE_16022_length_512_cov_0.995157_1_plen_47_part_10